LDNKGVIFALQPSCSRNKHLNRILMHICKTGEHYNIEIETACIKPSNNPADGPLQGILPLDMPQVQWLFTFSPDLSVVVVDTTHTKDFTRIFSNLNRLNVMTQLGL
jgi:hypothetical protein